VNTDELEFAASVPTEALADVRPGAPVALMVSGLGGSALTGHVSRVNATVDAATRQVKVYVAVPNRDHRLAGDMFATGRILLSQTRSSLAVPTSAVRAEPDGRTFAWVLAQGKIEKRAVRTGVHDELRDMVELASGLREGETVVVGPIEGLAPGQPVQITGEADSTARAVAGGTNPPATRTAASTPAGKPARAGRK
jgi:RND family efflux transporter MFP subunit